ncbi:MAG: (2Fe-2S)-binding protein [Myxococcales bacterium]|nr:(2Fe-2S)-binding protein [Polyangiaceae bacterium]MDW8248871.1 (2Fe-2S)-binding protein [Myxococcales bacterium]
MKILVCRCEDVTLHELDEAIARGHDDLESLKRYTGFGTGWCQGKACLALCAARLEAHRGQVITPFTARPPYHPIPLATLAALPELPEVHPDPIGGRRAG